MGMGIVDDKDFESQLNNTQLDSPVRKPVSEIVGPIPEVITPETHGLGRGKGNIEVPNALRRMIGEAHAVDGRAAGVELAKEFGISAHASDAYKNGTTTLGGKTNSTNKDFIRKSKDRAIKRATKRLNSALEYITDDKLQLASAKDLSGIAKDMAAVVKQLEPEEKTTNQNNGVQFVFYAPTIKTEDAYDIVVSPT